MKNTAITFDTKNRQMSILSIRFLVFYNTKNRQMSFSSRAKRCMASSFIGRTKELDSLKHLLDKRNTASLVVLKGRRRIGKSRLIEEFAKRNSFDHFYVFSGIPPTKKTTAQSERDEFSRQLGRMLNIEGIKAEDWSTLFLLLADRVQHGRTLILFDEISWMGSKDPDFLGKLKNAW